MALALPVPTPLLPSLRRSLLTGVLLLVHWFWVGRCLPPVLQPALAPLTLSCRDPPWSPAALAPALLASFLRPTQPPLPARALLLVAWCWEALCPPQAPQQRLRLPPLLWRPPPSSPVVLPPALLDPFLPLLQPPLLWALLLLQPWCWAAPLPLPALQQPPPAR